MSRNAKQFIAVILTVAILVVAWWGSYAPMRKAEIFISTLQNLQATPASSLQDLETRLAVPLDYSSPIGQEELVRNMANNILSFVQHSTDATTTAQLIGFMHHYYDPITDQGKGMSFSQDLYLLGAIHETAFAQTHDPQYLLAAQKYFEKGVEIGPDRPQSLYGLFDVYRFEGNVASATAIGDKILSLWPTDQNIAPSLSQLQAQVRAISPKPAAK
jgi:hypothetical protein